MKKIISGLVIIVLFTPSVFADNLFLETGPGICKSLDSEIFLLRYQKETSRLFGQPSYYEALAAHWNGKYREDAIGIGRGITFQPGEGKSVV